MVYEVKQTEKAVTSTYFKTLLFYALYKIYHQTDYVTLFIN